MVGKAVATQVLALTHRPIHQDDCFCELCQGWYWLHDLRVDQRIRWDARKWYTEKRDGKAVHTVNHVHDKPIEVNATLTLGEGMRLAMQRADERLRQR